MVQRPQRVYLHIGAPKTGTTYLQNVMWRNRHRLRELGVLYPVADGADAHFRATQELRGRHHHGTAAGREIVGSWANIVRAVRDWHGPAVISHETLSRLDTDEVDTVMRDLDGLEVHIVLTARDFARQVPAHWQEDIKNRGLLSYGEYIRALKGIDDTVNPFFANIFWRYQNLPEVLRTWAGGIPPERVHIVTAPPRGAVGEDTLWTRFARTVGIDPEQCPGDLPVRNPSMGVAETNLLRRLNTTLAQGTSQVPRPMTKHYFAVNVLAGRADSAPLQLPVDDQDWATQQATEIVRELRNTQYHVVGDLNELIPTWDADQPAPRHPDTTTDSELLDVALDALSHVLHDLHAARQRNRTEPRNTNRPSTSPRPQRITTTAARRTRRVLRGDAKAITAPLGRRRRW